MSEVAINIPDMKMINVEDDIFILGHIPEVGQGLSNFIIIELIVLN
jgi:hypothetical protein